VLRTARILGFCAALQLLAACDSGDLSTVKGPRSGDDTLKLDAGVLERDAGEPDDAGIAPVDASMPSDAGETETCECPALPVRCEQPMPDRAGFSPGAGWLEPLTNLIACADRTIHLAMYETELPCVVDALIARLDADPELRVDVVIDDDRCPRENGILSCELSRLDGRERATIIDDARSRYMHHKFAVIDGAFLWTASGNLTPRSLCTDFNDALLIEQPEIVAAYEAEFDRMFTAREFGPRPRTPPHTGGSYSVYFGPESPIAEPPSWHVAMLDAIRTASTSVDLMVFAWTHTDVAAALLEAYGRGVAIRGLVAPSYANDPPAQSAIAGGIPIRTASVHSKVVIVDGLLVITGTPNWSQNAWANDEASVWIEDPSLAEAYAERFDEIWAISRPPP
jgi:phosphatidylserine/phosphatidylglycerophosphate/cardiolipin synthase-like enzyme